MSKSTTSNLLHLLNRRASPLWQIEGKVVAVRGPIILGTLPHASVGDLCLIHKRDDTRLPCQVIGFERDIITLAPMDNLDGIYPHAKIVNTNAQPKVKLFGDPRGKVLDVLGKRIDRSEPDDATFELELFARPPCPLSRRKIDSSLCTGIKAIDTLCPIGYGQRIGVFAGAGVGKSTLLGSLARNADADVIVIALVGERGREVNTFLEEALGDVGRERSVVVVATSDESALRRSTAPYTATAIAEYYRDQGMRVLLLIDSLTRTARALRDIGLASGEVPVRQGFTPSVYAELPKLLERSGMSERGSITSIYTVLSSGEEEFDALEEEVKSLLDGHLVMSSEVARDNVRPAIDYTRSVSRLLGTLKDDLAVDLRNRFVRILSRLAKDKDLVLLGGQADDELEAILRSEPQIKGFLGQRPDEVYPEAVSVELLKMVVDLCEEIATPASPVNAQSRMI